MLEFLMKYQVYIMMSLSSVCIMLGILAAVQKTLPKKRKLSLVYIELAAGFLLFFDRFAYFYSGDVSDTGFWMVRVSNFLVFMLTISFLHATNIYLTDLALNEMGLDKVPVRIRISEALLMVGWILVICSQFTGLYYYFDESNNYIRGEAFFVSYIVPFVVLAMQMSLMVNYYKRLNRVLQISWFLFFALPIIAAVLQFYVYGVSFINLAIVCSAILLYFFAIKDINDKVDREKREELNMVVKERTRLQKGFDEAATAIATAVDAKNQYSKGHSVRVAEYSRDIARRAKLSEQQIYEVYYAALLHDIGKIGVDDAILRNGSASSEAQKDLFRQHAEIGAQILTAIKDYPYLPDAARYHHECYDGSGYPKGIQGEQIPLYARIVKVADVYDSLTSHKKNRGPLPQGKVREMFIMGSHKQFDPKFADIMVEMIDEDIGYKMREHEGMLVAEDIAEVLSYDITEIDELKFMDYKEVISDGLKLTPNITRLSFTSTPDEGQIPKNAVPAIIVFDSFDACVHTDERKIRNLHYLEFAELWADGHYISTRARNMRTTVTPEEKIVVPEGPVNYEVEAVRYKDHVKVKITSSFATVESTIALFDTARSVYIGLAGEHSIAKDIKVTHDENPVDENYIKRICGEIDIINLMDGDIPNVQIDEYRSATTEGIQVYDGVRLVFHSKTLPGTSTVSNCPYILLYSSEDGKVTGKGYKEYACVRIDGDDVTAVPEDGSSENTLTVQRKEEFVGWDAWKKYNQKGFECEVEFKRRKHNITFTTENAGVYVKCVSPIPKETDVYVALTGDRCAIMDIRSLD